MHLAWNCGQPSSEPARQVVTIHLTTAECLRAIQELKNEEVDRRLLEWRERYFPVCPRCGKVFHRPTQRKKVCTHCLPSRVGGNYLNQYFDQLVGKQKGICPLCKSALPLHNHLLMDIDHILPKSKGGADVADNLQVVHSSCNLRKGDRIEGCIMPTNWWTEPALRQGLFRF